MYVAEKTLTNALQSLNSTADHMLKIWLTLKHMGLSDKMPPVEIDTTNSTPSLKRLFSYGEPSGGFFVPFAHTARYATMRHDAAPMIPIPSVTVRQIPAIVPVEFCLPRTALDGRAGRFVRNLPAGLRILKWIAACEKEAVVVNDTRRVGNH